MVPTKWTAHAAKILKTASKHLFLCRVYSKNRNIFYSARWLDLSQRDFLFIHNIVELKLGIRKEVASMPLEMLQIKQCLRRHDPLFSGYKSIRYIGISEVSEESNLTPFLFCLLMISLLYSVFSFCCFQIIPHYSHGLTL